jgi:vacuolar-type H+-ATPase subunit H
MDGSGTQATQILGNGSSGADKGGAKGADGQDNSLAVKEPFRAAGEVVAQAKDAADEVIGQAKAAAGEVITQAKTVAGEALTSLAKDFAEQAPDIARKVRERAGPLAQDLYQRGGEYLSRNTQANPLALLLIAGAVGYGIGYLFSRR